MKPWGLVDEWIEAHGGREAIFPQEPSRDEIIYILQELIWEVEYEIKNLVTALGPPVRKDELMEDVQTAISELKRATTTAKAAAAIQTKGKK